MDEFKKSSIIMIVLTTLASGLNYLCQIVMGRVMATESFGVMNSLFSVILVLSVPGTSVNMLTAKQVAESENSAGAVARTMCRLCVLVGAVIFVIIGLTSGITAELMDTSPVLIVLTGTVVVASLFPYIISGVLSGKHTFLMAGLFSLIVPSFKMIGVISAAVLTGELKKQMAIMGAMILGNLVAVILCGRILWSKPTDDITNTNTYSTAVDQTALYVMMANLVYLLFANADIFLVTLCLGSETAGFYSSVMMFGRIIFYFTTALVSVLLPYVSHEQSAGGAPSRVFRNSLVMTLAVSALCTIPVNLFPEFFIQLIYGEKFLPATAYMPFSCAVSVIVSLVNLELIYFIGVGLEKKIFKDLFVALVVLVILVLWQHGSVQIVLLEISCVLAVLCFVELKNCLREDPITGTMKS